MAKNYYINCNNTPDDFITEHTEEGIERYWDGYRIAKELSMKYVSVDLCCEAMMVTELSMGEEVSVTIWRERFKQGKKIYRIELDI